MVTVTRYFCLRLGKNQLPFYFRDMIARISRQMVCSPRLIMSALNGTSLLAVTCPCKNQAGWPFWCPYRNVVFWPITLHRETNSEKPQVKIRFAFHFIKHKNVQYYCFQSAEIKENGGRFSDNYYQLVIYCRPL